MSELDCGSFSYLGSYFSSSLFSPSLFCLWIGSGVGMSRVLSDFFRRLFLLHTAILRLCSYFFLKWLCRGCPKLRGVIGFWLCLPLENCLARIFLSSKPAWTGCWSFSPRILLSRFLLRIGSVADLSPVCWRTSPLEKLDIPFFLCGSDRGIVFPLLSSFLSWSSASECSQIVLLARSPGAYKECILLFQYYSFVRSLRIPENRNFFHYMFGLRKASTLLRRYSLVLGLSLRHFCLLVFENKQYFIIRRTKNPCTTNGGRACTWIPPTPVTLYKPTRTLSAEALFGEETYMFWKYKKRILRLSVRSR